MTNKNTVKTAAVAHGERCPAIFGQLETDCAWSRIGRSILFLLLLVCACSQAAGSAGGLLFGQVFEDRNGLALADAKVELWHGKRSSSPPAVTARSDDSGRFQISVTPGPTTLRISAQGYSEAFRTLLFPVGKAKRVADIRLSRRTPIPPFDFRIGTRHQLQPGEAELQVPPGAFGEPVELFVTGLTPQAVVAPLPPGWRPRWTFEVQADSRALTAPLLVQMRQPPESGTLLASFDMAAQQWRRLEQGKPTGADGSTLFPLPGLGTVALLTADPAPFAPAMPEAGSVLQGVEAAAVPPSLEAGFTPLPEALFLRESGTVAVRVTLNAADRLPSGTLIGVELRESYHFHDGSVLLPEPRLYDHRLYRSAGQLSGEFMVAPDAIGLPVSQLSDGGITLHARHPDVLNGTVLLDSAGGRLSAGLSALGITVPEGALEHALPARMWLTPEPPELSALTYGVIGGFVLDLAGEHLHKPASLDLSAPLQLPKGKELLLFRTVQALQRSYYQLVAMPLSPEREKAWGLPGITEGGQYHLLRIDSPVGFARIGLSGAAIRGGGVLVNALNTRLAGVADAAAGGVVMPLPLGDHRLAARQPDTGLRGESPLRVRAEAQLQSVDIALKQHPLAVVKLSPAEGEKQVGTGAAIAIDLSERLDAASVDSASVRLYRGDERVDGSVELQSDGQSLLFRPARLLSENSLHRIEIAAGLRDRFGNPLAGNQPDGRYSSRFTTRDNTPPEPPEAGKIIAGTPDEKGIAVISGTQGSVEAGVLVTVRNRTTGVLASTQAGEDGGFSLAIAAGLIDNLELVLLDEGGNERILDIGRVTPPPGTAVLNATGGEIQGEKGTVAVIPKGLVGPDTIVRAEPLDTRGMVNPFSRELPGFIAGAMKFDVSGFEVADLLELELSIDGYPNFTTRDRVPLFRIERELRLPDELKPGSRLTLRLKALDQARQRAEISAEIEIVEKVTDAGSRIEQFDGAPSLQMVLPQQASPGQTIKVSARGDPPNIKFRFPASPILTGEEQFLLFAVREVNGKPFWDLADRAELKTLEDGSRVIQTTSPPYRGIRKDTSQLVMAVFASSSLAFVQAVNGITGGAHQVTQRIHQGVTDLDGARGVGGDTANAVADSLKGFEGLHALGTSLQSLTSWPDRNPHEFSVIPVRAGMPTTISVIREDTNTRMYAMDVPAMPPGSFSEVLVLGEDDNDLQVTGVTSPANHAVPLDATLALSFSHLIEPGSVNENSLRILDAKGNSIPARRDTNLNRDESAYIATITPEHPLDANAVYTLVATGAIKRAGQDLQQGEGLKEDFKFRFTTGGGLELAGKAELPWAKSFDVADDLLLVSQREASQGVNSFVTVDAANAGKPRVLKTTPLSLDRYGPIWSVRLMPDVDFVGRREQPVKGDLALVSAGNSGTFSSIQIYDVSNPATPGFRSNNLVSLPLDVVQESARLLVLPTLSNSMQTGSLALTDPNAAARSARGFIGGMALDWEVRDAFTANIDGIPKTTAYPWKVVTDNHSTLYFINVGIGLMTIDLTKAIPQGSPVTRGERFGPSYIPRDKAGAIVVRDDGKLQIRSSQFSITRPSHMERVGERVDVVGTISDNSIAEIRINGFRADISAPAGGRALTFEVKDLPLKEGVNELRATAFAGNGSELDSITQWVLRDYSENPLAGPGSVTLGLPPLSVVKSAAIAVGAGVKNAGQFDELWINGRIVAHCGSTAKQMRRTQRDRTASAGSVCEGSAEIALHPGVNSVVATAINLDEEFPEPYSAADLWVEEGLVLAVKDDLDIFDSSGLVRIRHLPIGTDEQPGKAVRVSVARGVTVDLDDDGKSGQQENEDGDEITLFDESRNLALLGEVAGKRLTFVDITEPHKAKVLGRMPSEHAIYSAAAVPDEGIAYVAADGALLTVDLTRAHHDGLLDLNGDGSDDRILNSLPIKGGGAQDVRVNAEKGLVYVLQRDLGVLIFRRSSACSRDYGVDITQIPERREVRFATQDLERTRLLKGLLEGMKSAQCAGQGFELNKNAALLSQGSSACIWADDAQCSTAYQPGLSDYDFEFIVPYQRITEAKACAIAMEDAIHDQPGLESADVSVFPVRDIALETAYRDVQPVTGDSCGGGDDIYGDLCLGRNGNILKWILEGEWVQSEDEIYNNHYDLDQVLERLKQPLHPPIGDDTDRYSERVDPRSGKRVAILKAGAESEPTHVPRLEGREWACLEDFALNQSAARIRIKGVGLGDVPVQSPVYSKKLHKVAKAGMRTLYGLLLSSPTGNRHMLDSSRAEYQGEKGCLTRVDKPEQADKIEQFGFKRCESFTEYIASRALLSVKLKLTDQEGRPLLTEQQALLGYRMFRHKADVGPQIDNEEAANQFIIDVLKFIDEVSAHEGVKDAYKRTVDGFSDGSERKRRLQLCNEQYLPRYKPELGAGDLRLKVPARLYNSSYVTGRSVNLALYHNDLEQARVSCDLQPGESHFLDKKGKLPKNCIDLDLRLQQVLDPDEEKALKKQPLFEIEPKLTGIHRVQFVADPEERYSEYDKGNNYDGFYYYLIGSNSSATPPQTTAVRPPPPKALPDPPASAACLIGQRAPPSPRLQLIALADKQYETAVAPGGDVALSWIVRNTGNEDITDIAVQDSRVGRISFPDLAAGQDATLDRQLKIEKTRDRPIIGISTVRGSDQEKNSVGPVSSVVKINVVAPPRGNPVVRIYSPPKQKPPFETQADSMPVWGYVESDEPLDWVRVNDKPVKVQQDEPGLYRFETETSDKYVPVAKEKITAIEVVARTRGESEGSDRVEVAWKGPDKKQPGQSDTRLRVIKRVRTQGLEGWHERVRAKPGDQLEYRILIVNDGPSDLRQVTVSDLDLIQPYIENDRAVKDAAGNPLFVLELPPMAPFDLAAGDDTQRDLVFKLPDDVGGGRIANRFYAAGIDSADLPVAGSDQAEVLIDAPAVKDDPKGGLALDPGIVLLRKPSGDDKKPTRPEHISVQLKVARVADGEDVTDSTKTRFEVADQILNPLAGRGGKTNPLVKVLWDKLKGFLSKKIQQKLDEKTKDKTGGKVSFKVPAMAQLEFAADGKMTAKSEGINMIRAVHQAPDGSEIYSNYALVIVGIGYVESIDIQPRSFASFGPQAVQYLTNLLAQKIKGDDDYNLLELNIPMFLVAPQKEAWGWSDYLTKWGPYLANWLGSTGFAELTSVKLDFLGGAISGVDILEAARYLLKLIPPVTVVVPTPVGPVPVAVPVGWFLAQLVGPTASQMVDFKAEGGAVSVRSSFPKGFVSAQAPGLGRVTGTLDFSASGFGLAKDAFLVFVGPELLSTELRPVNAADYPRLPKGSREAEIIVAGQRKGTTTLELELWEKSSGKERKVNSTSLSVEVVDPPANPADALPPILVEPANNKKVLVPQGGPRRLRVKLLETAAGSDQEIHVTEGNRQILAWARASEMKITQGDKGRVLSFARIGQQERITAPGKVKPEEKPIGIGLPNNADLVNYVGGGRMDAYLASLLPELSPETISKYREKAVQAVVPGCPYAGDIPLTLLADTPSEGLGNVSLDVKISFTAGKDDKGAAECQLVLKSYALGFPAPNFFNTYKFDATQGSHLLSDQGAPDATVAQFVDERNFLERLADYASWFSVIKIKPSDFYHGLEFEKEIAAAKPGRVHAGVETGAAIFGDDRADSYAPYEGMGGLTVQVVKSDEAGKQPPQCEDQLLWTLLDRPLDIRLQGASRSRDEADGMARLDVKIVGKPGRGELSGGTRKDRGSFEYRYTATRSGLDNFLYKVVEGKLESRQCKVNVLVIKLPEIGLPGIDFELPPPFCLPTYVKTEKNQPVDVTLLGFTLRSKIPGLPFAELTFDEFKPEGAVLKGLLDYFGYDQEQPLPFKGSVKGFPRKSKIGITSVRYVPDKDSFGLDMFFYKVDDGTRESRYCPVVVDVFDTPVDRKPEAINKSHDCSAQNGPVKSLFGGIDPEGAKLDIEVAPAGQPGHGKIIEMGPLLHSHKHTRRQFTYLPDEGFSGRDNVIYLVTDPSRNRDAGYISFNINKPPVCTEIIDKIAIDEDETRVLPIFMDDADNCGDRLQPKLQRSPTKGVVTALDRDSISYRSFKNVTAGVDSFSYVAYDGLNRSEPCAVTVTIQPNEKPKAIGRSLVVQKNSGHSDPRNSITLAGDDDPQQQLTFSFPGTSNQRGSVHAAQRLSAHAMLVTYAPRRDYAGLDGFRFLADDGKKRSTPATINIRVNAPPLARPDFATTDEDVPVVIDVLANDADPDGKQVRLDRFDATAYAADSTAVADIIRAGNALKVSPRPGYFGEFQFKYQIKDSDDAEAEQPGIVTVTVVHVNHPPQAKDDAADTREDEPVRIDVMANDSDPDKDDELYIDRVTQAGHGRVVNESGKVLYIPEANWSGADSFGYTIRDQDGEEAGAQVSVTVTPVNDPPFIPDQKYFLWCCRQAALKVLKDAADPDSAINPKSLSITSAPHKGSAAVRPEQGDITYKPDPVYRGRTALEVTVSDVGGAVSKPAKITLTIGSVAGLINEIVPSESRIELYNAQAESLDIKGWTIAGYTIGSQPGRESYSRLPKESGVDPSTRFPSGAHLVLTLPGADLRFGRIELRDAGGRLREALAPDDTCYEETGSGRRSLARRWDGFGANNACLEFHWVKKPTLGGAN